MSGRKAGRWGALVGALGLALTMGVLAIPSMNSVTVVSALPPSATDLNTVPHYYGPYPNWANSPQTLADAVVTISPPTPTLVSVGNPLIGRLHSSDYVIAPGSLGPVFVVLPNAVLPAGTIQGFQTWNQVTSTPIPSAGNLFHAYVLRPTGTANQYQTVYDSGQLTVPALAVPGVPAVATFPVTPFVAQAGDVLGFYGQGIPWDPAGTNIVSYPAPVPPAQGGTVTLGAAGFPILPPARAYSFSATVGIA